MKDICTCCLNPTIDISMTVDHVSANRKLRCRDVRRDAGGGGINVSRVLTRLGGGCTALFTAGGHTGGQLRDILQGEGIATVPLEVSEITREGVTVSERSSGQQYRFGEPGPRLSREEWESILDRIGSLDPPPGYLVASGSLPPGVPDDFYNRMMHRLEKTRFVADTSGKALHHAAQDGVFLIKPNMREIQELVGETIEDEQQLPRLAHRLIEEGRCRHVVVSLGAGGAFMATPGESFRINAPSVRIASRVGAGDSMVAGIVYALARGLTPEESLKWGVAAGSAAVMTPGTELCRRDDVEHLLTLL